MGRNTVKSDCLTDNRNVQLFSESQCGNGIVEAGEDCNCGGEESCGNNQCCDPKTCKFKANTVCDDSNKDCCKNCQFSSPNTVCRASTGSCNPEEKCTGNSSTCPADKHSDNGTSCGNGLMCASGQCTSRDQQCQTIMGDNLGSNVTTSCDGSRCMLSCHTPSDPDGLCHEMNQAFLDGTPCSGGGHCQNGICKDSSVGKEISEWIDTHKPLFIGLVAGIGGFIVLILISCVRRCMRPKNRRMAPMMRPPMGMGLGAGAPQNRGWTAVPPTPRGWSGSPQQPFQPPPAYGSTVAAQERMPSVRYA